jgi:hypothetical protein
MTAPRVGRVGIMAVVVAAIGGVLALAREVARYRHTSAVDWGHVAIALGVPILTYAIVWGAAARRPR